MRTPTYTDMATKTISLTEEAYERLKAKKKGHDSFSEVITRITKNKSLLHLAGLLTQEQAEHLEKTIAASRAASRKRMARNRLLL